MTTARYRSVTIDYTNWRGERSIRHIRPVALRFEENRFHEGEQWLLEAIDVVKDQTRIFAMKNIHSWSEMP
jgi:predicted DNA-binding transcriptional regulator YafY